MPLFGSSNTIAGKSDTRQRYHMVVMPALCGKSKIMSEMQKYTGAQKVVTVDVDALAASIVDADPALKALDTVANAAVLEATLMPTLEAKFLALLKNLQNDIVLCITANTRFVDQVQCKDKRLYIFLPAPDLLAQMVTEITATQGAEAAKTLQASRDNVLMWSKGKPNITTYTCPADITKVLADAFSLRLSAY
jgi:hypothetical protein